MWVSTMRALIAYDCPLQVVSRVLMADRVPTTTDVRLTQQHAYDMILNPLDSRNFADQGMVVDYPMNYACVVTITVTKLTCLCLTVIQTTYIVMKYVTGLSGVLASTQCCYSTA